MGKEVYVLSEQVKTHIVDFHGQRFYLTTAQAQELIRATNDGLKVVVIDDLVLSTSYAWIAPVEEVEGDRISIEEEEIIQKIGNWMLRPANDPTMDASQTWKYLVKVVKRIGSAQAYRLYDEYANGAYPSVPKFMSAVKNYVGPMRTSMIGGPNE